MSRSIIIDDCWISLDLIRFVWAELTINPRQSLREIACKWGHRWPSSVGRACRFLEQAGYVKTYGRYDREVVVPFREVRV